MELQLSNGITRSPTYWELERLKAGGGTDGKNVLEQYLELREEIKDLHDRIDRDKRRLIKIENEGVVSDTVRGTRKDGTIGPIKITGYPVPEVLPGEEYD